MEVSNFLFRLIICFLLSFCIGLERQYRRRIVGLRTIVLVSIGSFLFVSFSFSVGSYDISRIASQVVSGIGFLGAGVILKDGKKIRGLTTAATLWCVSAIGILTSGGAILEAIFGTIIILFSNTILRYIDKTNSLNIWSLKITSTSKELENIKKEVLEFLKLNNANITSINIDKEDNCILNIKFNLKNSKSNQLDNFIDKLLINLKIKNFELKKINDIDEN